MDYLPPPQANKSVHTRWNPVNDKFYEEDSSDEDKDYENPSPNINEDQLLDIEPEPITPPPSTEPTAHHITLSNSETSNSSLPDMEPTSD